MSEQPFMQLYVADYLGDTQHLSAEEHGVYLLLLMTMWRQDGRLPNDPKILARIARVSPRRWRLVSANVMPFFTVEGDQITQKRLQREHQKATSKSEKRSACGKLGGRPKSLKNMDEAKAKASDLLKHSSEARTQIPEKEKEDDDPTPAEASEAEAPSQGSGDHLRLVHDRGKSYAFEAGKIRLNEADFENWRKSFPNIDLRAELWGLSEWAGQQKNWFNAVTGALAKRNREAGRSLAEIRERASADAAQAAKARKIEPW